MSLPNPITRKEQYLAKAAGESVSIPEEPHTREEMYLKQIAEGGDPGGGGKYKRDLLFGSETITYPASQLSDCTLAHDVKDYDEIIFVTGWNQDDVYCVEEWRVQADILILMTTAASDPGFQYVFPNNSGITGGGQWMRVSMGDADNKVHFRYNGSVGIYQIYGVKF